MSLRTRQGRLPFWLPAAFMIVLLMAGCVASPSGPASTSAPLPTRALAPSRKSPAPSEVARRDAAAVLRTAVENHSQVRTVRGRIGLEIRDQGDEPGEPITTTIAFEYAKPNTRLTGSQHPSAPPRVEMILTDTAVYLSVENKWLATTPGTRPTEIKLLGFEALPSFLIAATNPRLVTSEAVELAGSDVVRFELEPAKVRELADLAAFKRAARDGVTIDSYTAQVALGTDELIRQMLFEVRGRDRAGSKHSFVERVTVELWDFNAADISVVAPAPGDLLDLDEHLAPTDTAGSK